MSGLVSYAIALWKATSGSLVGLGALLLLARWTRLRFLRRIENGWVTFADRTAPYAGPICFLFGCLIAMGIALCIRRPYAQVHDEASYLLAADTFAHGRWTNPALPEDIRAHFEALHIIVAPSYMSKYPPGQGLFLAVGELLGDPMFALCLGAGWCAAACRWMLEAFLPRRWAYLGGLLCALHPLVLKWSQSYWRGDLALIGGFLLLGGAGRLVTEASPRKEGAFLLAFGLALLANTRPFEGFCVTALVGIVLLPVLVRGLWKAPRVWFGRVIAPVGGTLAVTAALMLTYNSHVTGNPLTMPYVIHERTYGVVPLFWFQSLKPVPPTLRHESMRVINARASVRDYQLQHRFPLSTAISKSALLFRSAFQQFDLTAYWLDPKHRDNLWRTGFRYFLLLPLAGAFIASRRCVCKGTRAALIALPLFAACVCLETFINPHYGAPAGCFVALVLVDGLRHLRAIRIFSGRKRGGIVLVRMVVMLYLAAFVYHLTEFAEPRWQTPIQDRRPILKLLERFSGSKLVLVYYGNKPLPLSRNQEWVYNTANFASQPVLWARYLTPAENAHLLACFADRVPWVLDVTDPAHLRLRRFAEFNKDNRRIEGDKEDAGVKGIGLY